MLALYYYSYNHVKPHGSVRTKGNNRVTPAMASGIADRPATYEDLVAHRGVARDRCVKTQCPLKVPMPWSSSTRAPEALAFRPVHVECWV